LPYAIQNEDIYCQKRAENVINMRYRIVACVDFREMLTSQFPACDQIQVSLTGCDTKKLILAKVLQLVKASSANGVKFDY
jgi:hypothetical protein